MTALQIAALVAVVVAVAILLVLTPFVLYASIHTREETDRMLKRKRIPLGSRVLWAVWVICLLIFLIALDWLPMFSEVLGPIWNSFV